MLCARRCFFARRVLFWRRLTIATQESRVNDEIRAPQVRLIGVDGSQLGIFANSQAQKIALDQKLDLVEIAPNADQTKIAIKEMKFRPKIDVGDYETKKGHVLRFLGKGAKVKITIMFRGREMAHPEQGLSILERLADDLKGLAVVEQKPKMEGRNMHMLISPTPEARKKPASNKQQEGVDENAKDEDA